MTPYLKMKLVFVLTLVLGLSTVAFTQPKHIEPEKKEQFIAMFMSRLVRYDFSGVRAYVVNDEEGFFDHLVALKAEKKQIMTEQEKASFASRLPKPSDLLIKIQACEVDVKVGGLCGVEVCVDGECKNSELYLIQQQGFWRVDFSKSTIPYVFKFD